MTTSGRGRKPLGRPAAAPGTVPGTGRAAAHPPDDDTAPATSRADADTGPPDDVQELQQEIEQTREHLGETVDQLVAKTDVRARAQDKAVELTGRVKGKTGQARTQAAVRAGKVRDQLARKTAGAGRRAKSAGTAVKEQLPGRVASAGAPVWQATPEPVRQAVAKAASTARQRRVPLAVAASVLIVGYLGIRRWRRR
jgi:Protein of unknown function (DUF3618)